MTDDTLRAELLAMRAQDEAVRAELAQDGRLFQGYHPRMEAVHRKNGERLAAILDTRGWPDRSLVGEDGAEAAWLIAQHAIGMPALQRRARELLEEAVARREADPATLAFLDDRIRTLEGRSQKYGTQFDWNAEGNMSPLPIEDPEGVDERRRSVGLEPLEARIQKVRADSAGKGEPVPEDIERRRREFEEWARSVGWRA